MPRCIEPCEGRYIGSRGIARHRQMHRERGERVVEQLKSGVWVWDFRPEADDADREE